MDSLFLFLHQTDWEGALLLAGGGRLLYSAIHLFAFIKTRLLTTSAEKRMTDEESRHITHFVIADTIFLLMLIVAPFAL